MRSERLVHLALVGATAASTATLAWDGAFPPAGSGFNDVLAEGRGWSAVTLFLAVPLGLVALNAARRGSVRARVAVGGVMAYLFYTYLEMAVSPPFTALYLVYVGTFAAASWAGVATLAGLEDRAVEEAFAGAPRRVVGAFGIAFAVLLSAAWLKGIVADTVAGRFGYPQGAQAVGHVVHALDLGLMVPLGLGSGLLLLRRDPVAWRIAGVMVVVAGCMAPALAAMVGTSLWTQGQSLVGVLPFALLAAWSLGLLAVVFVGPRLATPLSTRVDARTVGRRS